MSELERHFKEELELSLDVALPPELQSELDAHLAACEECRSEYESLRWTKEAAARTANSVHVPPDLVPQIRAALDREDALEAEATGGAKRSEQYSFTWLAAAAVVVAAVGSWWMLSRNALDVPQAVVSDYQRYRLGEIELSHFTNDGPALERFFAAEGITFQTRVLDLAMMNYEVVGGRVQDLMGQRSSMFVYEGSGDQTLVCRMYEGRVEELPDTDDRRVHDGIAFFVYERDGHTVVFWQEGDVVCALVSDIDREAVVALAFAKAMKV